MLSWKVFVILFHIINVTNISPINMALTSNHFQKRIWKHKISLNSTNLINMQFFVLNANIKTGFIYIYDLSLN